MLTVQNNNPVISSLCVQALVRDHPAPWMAEQLTTVAWCWKITRKDGAVLGFTSHDVDLTIDGVTYEAATGFTPSAVATSRDMSVDDLDVDGMIDSEKITKDDIRAGKYKGASVEVFLCNWANLADPIFVLRKGYIGEISVGNNHFTAEIRGLMQLLQQTPNEIFQKSCRATLGDSKCGINVSGYTTTGTVTNVNPDGSFATDLAAADSYYDYGLITFIGGDNAGISHEIKTYVNGVITSFLPIYYALAVGDTFSVIAGCDGNFSTCKAKFNNAVNFRGEPHVPGNDYATSYPATGVNIVAAGGNVKR